MFAGLFGAYAAVDAEGRRLLEARLPSLLAQAHPLRGALRDCPERVAAAFCHEVWGWLSPLRADVGLARRVFAALAPPDASWPPALTEGLLTAFERVLHWRRRDLGALVRDLEDDGLAQSFLDWRDAQRASTKRRLFGGNRRREEEA